MQTSPRHVTLRNLFSSFKVLTQTMMLLRQTDTYIFKFRNILRIL